MFIRGLKKPSFPRETDIIHPVLTEIERTSDKFLLRNVRVLDVAGGALSDPVGVLTAGGIIREIGVRAEPGGCDAVDGEGRTLIPGLINCHAHILSPYLSEQRGIPGAWALRQARLNLAACLAAGVVCVRDMLSPIKVMNIYRRKIASGALAGPDILASGAILSCKGGYPEFISPLAFPLSAIGGQPKLNLHSPKKAAAMVRYLKKSGADHIKIGYTSFTRDFESRERMPVMSPEVFDAVCAAAHEAGLIVCVHHNWSEDLAPILSHDIDTLEHLIFDREITDDEVAAIKKKGVTVVPTLTVTDSMARFEERKGFYESARAREMLTEQARAHLLWISSTWLDFKGESYQKVFGHWRANRGKYAATERTASRLHAAGVPMCAGTDLGAVVVCPGELADEVKRLHHIGMSRLEAVQSATLNAARLLGIESRLGTVEPGKKADVALVDGNPLEDLDALRCVRLVGKGGRWFRPAHPEAPDFWQGSNAVFEGK